MKILILQQGSWTRKFGIPLIDYLRENMPEARFSAVIVNPIARIDVEKHDFPYEHLWDRSAVDDDVLSSDFKQRHGQISMADIERELDIDSVWMRLIYAQRSLVYTPGVKHRYSWDQQIDDDTCLDVVRSSFVAVKSIFEEWRPDIIITANYVSLFHNCLHHYAKKRGVGMWRVNSTRISGQYILADDNQHKLERVVKRYKTRDVSQNSLLFAREYVEKFRAEYIPPENFTNLSERLQETNYRPLILRAITKFYKIPGRLFEMWQRSRNSEYSQLLRTIGNLPLHLELKNKLLQLLYARATNRLHYHQPSHGENYSYFPLQFQPEETIMLWAPYWNNQIEMARQVAMSLPEGMTLYVKDHPTMIGRRRPSYYHKLISTPNVKLIHPLHPNHALITSDNCKAVISLAGSSGFEAIVAGKPVLSFADNFYEVLPHCEKITDLNRINPTIKKFMGLDLCTEAFNNELINLIGAIKDESFEMNYASIWGLSKTGDKSTLFKAFFDVVSDALRTKPEKSESET